MQPRAVTFDCWSTLIHEVQSPFGPGTRAHMLAQFVRTDEARASAALRAAWRQHQMLWHRRQAFTGADMTKMALDLLGVAPDIGRLSELVEDLENEILSHEIRALPGSREALERLASAGVRIALICDTGYSPGRVVRQLLDRVGLLEYLEVTIFSDEIGVPKPHPLAFRMALEPFGVSPQHAVHVGDLRRSDIAGAHAFGMRSVRITLHHDDSDDGPRMNSGVIDCETAGCDPRCERPEADAVVATYDDVIRALDHR